MVAQVGYSVARRSRGRVALCAVCTVHMETRSAGFLVEPQNQGLRFVSGLASKPLRRFLGLGIKAKVNGFVVCPQNHCYGLVIWASKSPRRFLGLGLKTKGRRFVSLRLKTDEQMKTV